MRKCQVPRKAGSRRGRLLPAISSVQMIGSHSVEVTGSHVIARNVPWREPTRVISCTLMKGISCLLVALTLYGCNGSEGKAKFNYKTDSLHMLGIMSLEVFEKMDESGFDAASYPDREALAISDFLGRKDFEYAGDRLEFKDKFGNPSMIRRVGSQWELMTFGYNKIDEKGEGDDLVMPISADW